MKKWFDILLVVILYWIPIAKVYWLMFRVPSSRYRYLMYTIYSSRELYGQQKNSMHLSWRRGVGRVICVNDRINGHGLTDRLRGMVTLYGYCREQGIRYGIHFLHPFSLTDYLLPAEYDWLQLEQFYHSGNTNCVYISEVPGDCYACPGHDSQEEKWANQRWVLDIFCSLPIDTLQILTNVSFLQNRYSELYNELFRPVEQVSRAVSLIQQQMEPEYISISFRFLNLLGDSLENIHGYEPITEDAKMKLIGDCHLEVEKLHEQYPNKAILLTSDSYSFLTSFSSEQYPFIHYMLGDKLHHHMGLTENDGGIDYLKSFVDMYLIAGAEKVFQVCLGSMYHSTFPLYASFLGNSEYCLLQFN